MIIHNIKGADFLHGLIQGNNTTNPREVGDPLPSQGASDAFTAGTTRVLDLLKSNSDLNQVIETLIGPMRLANFIMFPILDIVIHKWGPGQGDRPGHFSGQRSVGGMLWGDANGGWGGGGRQAGVFGPEVTVPISASIQDKLLGIRGRQP